MDLHPQSPCEGNQLVVGEFSFTAFDLRNLRLIHVESESRQPTGHVVLGDLRLGRDPQALDFFAGDVASFAFGTQGALVGAPILLLFGSGIILFQNKKAFLFVPPRDQPLAILCVDDHTLVGDALTRLFRTAGYLVEHADDGESAWAKVVEHPNRFDVLVTDHQMPHLDGSGLVARLRDSDFAGRIIVYSSALNDEDFARYRALHVDAIVVKGPDTARLLAVVEAFNKHP